MINTWRYVRETQGHALDVSLSCCESDIVRLVDWLERCSLDELFTSLVSYRAEGVKYLVAAPSKKKRSFKSEEALFSTIASAMWHGKMASLLIAEIDDVDALAPGGSYRSMTERMATAAYDLFLQTGFPKPLLEEIIVDASDYRPWSDFDPELLDRIEPWLYRIDD